MSCLAHPLYIIYYFQFCNYVFSLKFYYYLLLPISFWRYLKMLRFITPISVYTFSIDLHFLESLSRFCKIKKDFRKGSGDGRRVNFGLYHSRHSFSISLWKIIYDLVIIVIILLDKINVNSGRKFRVLTQPVWETIWIWI